MWGMSMAYPNPFSSGFVEQVDKVQAATGEDQTAAPRYCEACDRDFGSLKDYEAHIAAHVPCPVRGCNFKGARRAVNIHLDDAHSNDKAKKPLVTDTPEDIKRWIAERKKNWPSAANMERKAKELLETKSSSPAGGLKRKGGDDQRCVRRCSRGVILDWLPVRSDHAASGRMGGVHSGISATFHTLSLKRSGPNGHVITLRRGNANTARDVATPTILMMRVSNPRRCRKRSSRAC
eukprot:TRINITY_DN19670_c0_g1_i4.p1 TRINITY_DN19670_c0_g1~~TRINITY_DN19670_c0_g1_i4.p1  ORF type:complete len:235 (+),score=11.08 TRINITY_DN19670_c0_g1_i4:62-766(+)